MAEDWKEWPALFTATIKPDPRALTKLKDPVLRKKQYLRVIKWIARQNTGIRKVVFCENSDSDLEAFKSLYPWFSRRGFSLEVYPIPELGKSIFLGKGWEEGLMIRWALENIESLAQVKAFIKMSGRYKILNLNRIIKIIHQALKLNPDLKFICQNFKNKPQLHTDTVFFWSDRQFYLDHLLDAYEEVNDNKGLYIEHAIAQRLNRLRNRFEIGVLPIPLILKGLRGSDSRPVMTLRDIVREKTKQVLFSTPPVKLIFHSD